jgi:hypothetical protein
MEAARSQLRRSGGAVSQRRGHAIEPQQYSSELQKVKAFNAGPIDDRIRRR